MDGFDQTSTVLTASSWPSVSSSSRLVSIGDYFLLYFSSGWFNLLAFMCNYLACSSIIIEKKTRELLVAVVMTVAKIACAIVSCATALMLVHIIPDLLSVKTRELFLKNKAEELDREMGLILTQEETGRHVRMQCVYHITAHWLGSGPFLVGTLPPEVVAVRVPLLHLSNFQINDWPELSAKSYAVMVLILPTESARKWRDHELELVEVVADQVLHWHSGHKIDCQQLSLSVDSSSSKNGATQQRSLKASTKIWSIVQIYICI
ncbi:hypothetical protein NC653_037122 [Populus alba x Populus x berolinensis]|uniref:Ethylene receptor 1-like N-terminal domain-containing protein n=1 Tax=Populus alba x Populus x berolinensis TaxID=444605 RepID=A0AAD6LLS1_9ROSI|nr:hypothetical protein NC653_037122 [Populus alba x Populus x berolinensis]